MSEVYYIELNNWLSGRDYPINGKLRELVENHSFSNDEWCKENKLCVLCGNVDMSINWCITAPAEWVEENCPELLGDKEYTYEVHVYSRGENKVNIHKRKYCDFLRPEEGDTASSRFGVNFLEYREENFGVTTCEYEW